MKRALSLLALVLAGCPLAEAPPDAGLPTPDAGDGSGDDAGPTEQPDAGITFSDEVRIERSLAWTEPALLDAPDIVGLARVMQPAAAALGTTPGALLRAWLVRFSTTAHSERAGPARLAQQLDDTLGADAATWDVDQAPFRVTAVHNRIDLWRPDGDGALHCGELRVSLASTDPIHRPFHILFLFRQPDDGLRCRPTALRWAELSSLDGDAFVQAARELLEEGLTAERFLLTESVELTVSPWEWRQWVPAGSTLDNPLLFQQIDTEGLNVAGPRRDALLAFVNANAAALDARTLLLPDNLRAPSVRVTQGVPWVPLDLTGADPGVLAAYPSLRQQLEIVGCAACHSADAEFVQTREDRTFSPFYTEELEARAAYLPALVDGSAAPAPFGPLQPDPILPP